jgi:hypothetical protein
MAFNEIYVGTEFNEDNIEYQLNYGGKGRMEIQFGDDVSTRRSLRLFHEDHWRLCDHCGIAYRIDKRPDSNYCSETCHQEDYDDASVAYDDKQERLDLVAELMRIRGNWERKDFQEAYGDEWDFDITDRKGKSLVELHETMEEHVNLTYDTDYIKEVIENETPEKF